MIALYEIFRKDKSAYTESRSVVAQGWKQGLVVNAPKKTFWGDYFKTILKLDCGDGYTAL